MLRVSGAKIIAELLRSRARVGRATKPAALERFAPARVSRSARAATRLVWRGRRKMLCSVGVLLRRTYPRLRSAVAMLAPNPASGASCGSPKLAHRMARCMAHAHLHLGLVRKLPPCRLDYQGGSATRKHGLALQP